MNVIKTMRDLDHLINQGAISLDPLAFTVTPEVQLAWSQFNEADRIQRSGDGDRAISAYEGLLVAWPDFVAPRFNAATLLASLGREDEAQSHVEILLSLAPQDPDVFFLAGKLAGDAGDRFVELAYYNRALAWHAHNPKLLLYLAITYRQVGYWDVASIWLDRFESLVGPAASLFPELRYQGLLNRGVIHEHFERWREAYYTYAECQDTAVTREAQAGLERTKARLRFAAAERREGEFDRRGGR